MQIKNYYINQEEFGEALKEVLDSYIQGKIRDRELKKIILKLLELNQERYYSNGKVAEKIKRKLGKKRLGIIEKIFENK